MVRPKSEPARPRCAATSKTTGEPCKQTAIPGGRVCRFHGGSASQVKRKAALRIAELVEPAIGTLAREMVKAQKSSDRLRAANSILDRAGISRSQAADVEVARAVLLERLLQAQGAPRTAPEPMELVAEVVDDQAAGGRDG